MDKIKSYFAFAFKVLIALWIINGLLTFVGAGISSIVTNPIGWLYAKFVASKAPATGS